MTDFMDHTIWVVVFTYPYFTDAIHAACLSCRARWLIWYFIHQAQMDKGAVMQGRRFQWTRRATHNKQAGNQPAKHKTNSTFTRPQLSGHPQLSFLALLSF